MCLIYSVLWEEQMVIKIKLLVNFLLLISTLFHKRLLFMLPHSTPDLPNSRERLSLKPLSLNIPIPNHQASSKGQNPLDNLIQPRSPPPTSDRKNKSASLKTIAQLKQILSKSLFHKKPPLECQIKQKPKDDLACRKSDSKPISP